jgi:hypothetical protein
VDKHGDVRDQCHVRGLRWHRLDPAVVISLWGRHAPDAQESRSTHPIKLIINEKTKGICPVHYNGSK